MCVGEAMSRVATEVCTSPNQGQRLAFQLGPPVTGPSSGLSCLLLASEPQHNHLNLSLPSGPKRQQSNQKVGHHSPPHTHTRFKKKKRRKKKHFVTEASEWLMVMLAVISGPPPLNGAFTDSSKRPFLQGHSACIVSVLIRTASTSKLCME